jgi:hypothetical protein
MDTGSQIAPRPGTSHGRPSCLSSSPALATTARKDYRENEPRSRFSLIWSCFTSRPSKASSTHAVAAAVRFRASRRGSHSACHAPAAIAGAAADDRSLRHQLLDVAEVTRYMTPEAIDAALDPERYLGSSQIFVRRSLERFRKEVES